MSGPAENPQGQGAEDEAPDLHGTQDPAEMLKILEDQRAAFAARTTVSSQVIALAWGVAWLIGYVALWMSTSSPGREVLNLGPAGAIIFAACILGAVIVTITHIALRTRGVRGISSRQGEMYGVSWFVSMTGGGMCVGALGNMDVRDDVMGIAANSIFVLIVATNYMVAGALWEDRTWLYLGVWMVLVASAAAYIGADYASLFMAFAGGGAFLGAGLIAALVARRRSRREAQP